MYGVVFLVICWGIAARAEDRSFSVEDDIEMVRFSDPSETAPGSMAKFSPDRKHFAIVASKGILKTDQIESDLLVFDSSEVEHFVDGIGTVGSLHPQTRFARTAALDTEQSSAFGAVITQLRWSSDSGRLYFIAGDVSSDQRLYRLDIGAVAPTVLSPAGYSVVRYDFVGDTVAFSAYPSKGTESETAHLPQYGNSENPDAWPVGGLSLKRILFPDVEPAPSKRELWIVHHVGKHYRAKRIDHSSYSDISWLPEAFAISPQGRQLIQLQPVRSVSDSWTRYLPPAAYSWMQVRTDDPGQVAPDNLWRLKEYFLVDLATGKSEPLIEAPQGFVLIYPRDTAALWSRDETRLLVTNTFFPLEGLDVEEQKKRTRPCAVAEVELVSKTPYCIVPMPDNAPDGITKVLSDSLGFGASPGEVEMTVALTNGKLEKRTYSLHHGQWLLTSAITSSDREVATKDLKVSIEQALNEPPTLWAKDTRTGKAREIWNPNPQFEHLQFGQASVVHWKDRSGRDWKGGLVKPVGYVPGKRYPLVVQIYSFDERRFITDGDFPTAFSARQLASAGIVALQVQRKPHSFDSGEGDLQLEGIESGIDELAKDGLVDPQKVGLTGFSTTAWYVEYALIKNPTRFAAATIADGIDMSYMQYQLWGPFLPSFAREFEAILGGTPFGEENLSEWMHHALGFQLNYVITPLRIEAITPTSVLSEWELYSSLIQQGKPVDLIYFPRGQHIHQKPQERFESQQGNVDWFRFWLQDYRDPDPAKRNQYVRWDKLSRTRQ